MRFLRIIQISVWLFLFFGGSHTVFANEPTDTLSAQVAELNRLFNKIYSCPPDHRWNASDSFQLVAKTIMEEYAGRDFPFEKVKKLNYFKGEELSFRMLNWGVPEQDGTTIYRALLQVHRLTKDDYILYEMSDMSLYQPFPEKLVCHPESWWGAFYYECIQKQSGSQTYYTFLGWNSGQELYQQSVIEVMSIKPNGEVRFGASLFANRGRIAGSNRIDKSIKDSEIKRIVFRFSKKTGMILRYDYQTYVIKGDNGKEKTKKTNMIIFDRLMPQQSAMADDYNYYIPEGGAYQAYVFDNGKWRLQNSVVARNPEPKKKR